MGSVVGRCSDTRNKGSESQENRCRAQGIRGKASNLRPKETPKIRIFLGPRELRLHTVAWTLRQTGMPSPNSPKWFRPKMRPPSKTRAKKEDSEHPENRRNVSGELAIAPCVVISEIDLVIAVRSELVGDQGERIRSRNTRQRIRVRPAISVIHDIGELKGGKPERGARFIGRVSANAH